MEKILSPATFLHGNGSPIGIIVKLGISAPKDVTINREEVIREINEENALSSSSSIINHIKE